MTRKHHRAPRRAPQARVRLAAAHQPAVVMSESMTDAELTRMARALHISKRALAEGMKAAAEAFTVEVCIFVLVRVSLSVGAVSLAAIFLHN